MKKIAIILLTFFSLSINAQVWNPVGPDTLNVNDYMFDLNTGAEFLACEQGLCVKLDNETEWNLYDFSLPVKGFVGFDESSILLVMGNGSYSDGVYFFSIEDNTFTVADYFIRPNFIIYDGSTYYLGAEDGVYSSSDGSSWSLSKSVENAIAMAVDGTCQYLVEMMVDGSDSTYNLWRTLDGGANWDSLYFNNLRIDDIGVADNHNVYFTAGGISYSSGVYYSEDSLATFEVGFYSPYLNTVYIQGNDVYLGRDEGVHTAIASWEGGNVSELDADLPCLFINEIKFNPMVNCVNIVACTQEGAYIRCLNIGVDEIANENNIVVCPNPFTDNLYLNVNEFEGEDLIVELYNIAGEKILANKVSSTGTMQVGTDLSDLPRGVYLIKVVGSDETIFQKVIKQ